MPASKQEIQDWLDWREKQRKRHRVMTLGEYIVWNRGGDAISCPSSTNAFPGGLTIDFNTPPIIGKFRDSFER